MGIGKLNNLRSAHVTELNQPLESNSSKRVFLSPEEFGQLSGLSVPTIHRYLKSGRLPFNQPGGHRCRILIHKNVLISSGKTPSVNSLLEPSCTKQSQTKVSGPEPAWKKKHNTAKRTTKSGYERMCPLHSELIALLEKMPNRSGNVFRGPRGGQLKPDTVRLILVRDVITPLTKNFPHGEDEIGFADGRLHSFRHYFCSTCANSGIPENMVMRWLGHRSSEMVQHYYHLHDAEAKRRMDTLNFIG